MTRERFIEIMESDLDCDWEGCNAFAGLKIITKYLPKKGIEGAEHDTIFSVTISEILETDITEEDVMKLKRLNWMIDETNTGLACYV